MKDEFRRWHWFDWIIVSLYFVIIVGLLLYDMSTTVPSKLPIIGFSWFLLVFFLSFWFWNTKGVYLKLAKRVEIFHIVILFILVATIDQNFIYLIMFHSLQLGYMNHRKGIGWTFLLLVSFILGSAFLHEYVWSEFWMISVTALINLGSGYSFNRIVFSDQRQKELLEENKKQFQTIQEQNNLLVTYADQVERMAIIEERNRMAKELHDTIGHTFTSVIMGMDAISYLMSVDPEKAQVKLDHLRDVMRNGLEDVRANIHKMAENDGATLSVQLIRLINEFAKSTGISIYLQTKGEEYSVSTPISWTFIRCLQESLTNSIRHGRATIIEVELTFQLHSLQLAVTDNGDGVEEVKFGFGLTSMKERLATLGGKMNLNSRADKGMILTCSIPVRREECGESKAFVSR
ncbi:signal transduction histidine kinase [Croceifilum oryzae]|uniref:histidine kinase n=1 Tax=Croceifilum oryzae TaxID=1553429 RepID=A0AAJ1TM41_9BACL|nr:sensor histidine kinase [Croceifilum oryzae]MDQ0418416.1 signal transduction histidine kinase [Croceifilum oryzae]